MTHVAEPRQVIREGWKLHLRRRERVLG